MTDSQSNETPLESWKDIAAHLQRDVRTLMRWEKKEGLPVHRHLHHSRASVYAYPSELDAWRANREPDTGSAHSVWLRPVPALASTIALAMALMMAGSGPPVGAAAQAADGIVTRQVWTGADGVFSNAPSPDGRYMTYVDWESGNLGIRDLEAETNRLVTTDGTWEEPSQIAYASTWSPDGSQIVYSVQEAESAMELCILDVDKPEPRVLYHDESDGVWIEPQDWSPDGQQILASISRTGQGDQLTLIPVDGSAPRVLKTFEASTLTSGIARFSPDGRYVVYDRTPGQVAALDLFVLDVDSGEECPLIQHPADDCLFGWSPDGNWALFLSDRAGTLDFWTIRVADGKPVGTPVRVKRSVGRAAPLGFAEDGTYYYADVKVARDIYSARVDFDQARLLEPAEKAIDRYEGSNMNPRYSPDGKSLAYISRRGSLVFPTNTGNALCVRSLDDGSEHVFMDEFVKLGVRTVAGPRWSSDSRSIVVAGLSVVGAESGLYLVSLDNGAVRPVVELPAGISVRNHEWLPMAQSLVYVRQDMNQDLWQILVRDIETGEERELYRTTGDRHLMLGIAASPDGESLAIVARNQGVLSLMPANGGPLREVRHFEQRQLTAPDWTPDGKYIVLGAYTPGEKGSTILYGVPANGGQPREIPMARRFWDRISVHPDNQRIAFASTINFDSDADVWTMENFLPAVEAQP